MNAEACNGDEPAMRGKAIEQGEGFQEGLLLGMAKGDVSCTCDVQKLSVTYETLWA